MKCFECECSAEILSISMPGCQSPRRLSCCPAKSCSPLSELVFSCSKHKSPLFSKSHCYIAVFMQCITVGPYLKLTMASSQCCHSNKMSWSSHLRAGEGWGWPFLVGLPAAKELDATLSAVCDWLWWTSLLKHNSLPTITTPFQIQPQSR